MARSIWSGSITFGLVNVPVKLYSAITDCDVHFHLLSKDGSCRLRRRLYCPETKTEYDFQDTAKGFQVGPDQFLIVREEELRRLKPEAGRTISIQDFVDLDAIDPIYFDVPYYAAPDVRGTHAFGLLLEVMQRTRKAAIARFVMRTREYLAVLRPLAGIICVQTMHFADEVIPVHDAVGPVAAPKVNPREREAAEELVMALAAAFEPQKYHNDYRERLMDFLERKAAGEKIPAPEAGFERPPHVINLMEALKRSLSDTARAGRAKAPARSAPRRARAHKKSA